MKIPVEDTIRFIQIFKSQLTLKTCFTGGIKPPFVNFLKPVWKFNLLCFISKKQEES